MDLAVGYQVGVPVIFMREQAEPNDADIARLVLALRPLTLQSLVECRSLCARLLLVALPTVAVASGARADFSWSRRFRPFQE